jgi:CysZ protein
VTLARAISGALWFLRGILFLLANPSLWPLVVLPAVVAGVLLLSGFALGVWAGPWVEQHLLSAGPTPPALEVLVRFIARVASAVAGTALGLGLALLLIAPILDRISRKVERIVRGAVDDRGSGLAWEIEQSLRGSFYFLAAAPGILLLALIPLIGPLLALLWGGFALSFQFTDPPLTRRGLDFQAKRGWHRRHRPEAVGFGLVGLLAFVIPLADLFVAPALAVGGTLLVLNLEEPTMYQ